MARVRLIRFRRARNTFTLAARRSRASASRAIFGGARGNWRASMPPWSYRRPATPSCTTTSRVSCASCIETPARGAAARAPSRSVLGTRARPWTQRPTRGWAAPARSRRRPRPCGRSSVLPRGAACRRRRPCRGSATGATRRRRFSEGWNGRLRRSPLPRRTRSREGGHKMLCCSNSMAERGMY